MTAVLGGATFFPDMPSKGPRCNSNISAIRFESLNCQERMMAATGRRAVKGEHARRLISEVFRRCCGTAALVTMQQWRLCRIREKLNANGDGI